MKVLILALFRGWAFFSFLLFGMLALISALIAPQRIRNILVSKCSRAFVRTSFYPLKEEGLRELFDGSQKMFICNHASYLDVILLTACLPPQTRYVAKAELLSVPLLGKALQSIGVLFVLRNEPHKSLEAYRTIKRSLKDGDSILIFPEGTFGKENHLLPFHLGAFLLAVETRTPIVPLIVEGTREALPEGSNTFRYASLRVRTLPWVVSESRSPREAERIKDELEKRYHQELFGNDHSKVKDNP